MNFCVTVIFHVKTKDFFTLRLTLKHVVNKLKRKSSDLTITGSVLQIFDLHSIFWSKPVPLFKKIFDHISAVFELNSFVFYSKVNKFTVCVRVVVEYADIFVLTNNFAKTFSTGAQLEIKYTQKRVKTL